MNWKAAVKRYRSELIAASELIIALRKILYQTEGERARLFDMLTETQTRCTKLVMERRARIDAEGAAKPLTEIVGVFPAGATNWYHNAEELIARPTDSSTDTTCASASGSVAQVQMPPGAKGPATVDGPLCMCECRPATLCYECAQENREVWLWAIGREIVEDLDKMSVNDEDTIGIQKAVYIVKRWLAKNAGY